MKSGFPHIPAFRIAIFLLAGIVLQLQNTFSLASLAIGLIGLCATFCPLFFSRWGNRNLKRIRLQGSLFIAACILCGCLLVELHDPRNQQSFFGNYIPGAETFRCRVIEPPEIKEKSIKLMVEVKEMYNASQHANTTGDAIIYLAKKDLPVMPGYGSEIIVRNTFNTPSTSNNPGAFDYAKYLEAHNIYYTAYLNSGEYSMSQYNTPRRFWSFIFNCRQYFSRQIIENVSDREVQGIALALILGNRTLLEPETKAHYINTGTMHVLAVSGLHVGIFYAILEILLSFIPFFKKKNNKTSLRYLKPCIIILCIWIYGCITGLSPSIFRSAIMFTMLALGRMDGKHINSFNILAASAILLMFINPFMVLDIGFQLSFLAVLGIIAFQPYLSKILRVKHPVPQYIWTLTTVSIAAQMGTVPITIYYFHQFPNYFLLTNMVAIPLSFLILVSGILLFAISWIPVIATYAGWLIYFPVKLMNESMAIAESLPGATIEYIQWSLSQTVLMCLLFVNVAILLSSKNKDYLYGFAIMLFLFIAATFQTLIQREQFKALSFMQVDNQTVISMQYTNTLYLFTEETIDPSSATFQYAIKPVMQFYGENTYTSVCLDSNFTSEGIVINGNTIIAGNTTITTIANSNTNISALPQTDYIFICNNPFLNLEQLAEKFNNSVWIFDNTNSYKSISYWIKFCTENNIRFHSLKSAGALNIQI